MNWLLIPFVIIILMVVAAAFAIFLFVFWLVMLVDVIKRKFKSDIDKVVWVLILIFLHLIGALIYYFLVYRK